MNQEAFLLHEVDFFVFCVSIFCILRVRQQYYRLFHSKAKISEEDYETSLQNAVKRLVKAALENERKLLEKAAELLNE